MAIEITYTPEFDRQLKRLAGKYPAIYKDLDTLLDELETNPVIGKPLGKNLYKIRMALSNKTKAKVAGQEYNLCFDKE